MLNIIITNKITNKTHKNSKQILLKYFFVIIYNKKMEDITINTLFESCCIDDNLQYAKIIYSKNLDFFNKYDNTLLVFYFHLSCLSGSINVAKWLLKIRQNINNLKLCDAFHKCHHYLQKKSILWITQLLERNVWHYHNDKTEKTTWYIYTKKQKVAKLS